MADILKCVTSLWYFGMLLIGLVHNHSYENEFNLHVKEISFSNERMSTKTRFEEEAEGNSEMA